jgi:hypothetical protein
MNNFEDELDTIRIKLYEETKNMDTTLLVNTVNSHARKIADEFGFKIMNSDSHVNTVKKAATK